MPCWRTSLRRASRRSKGSRTRSTYAPRSSRGRRSSSAGWEESARGGARPPRALLSSSRTCWATCSSQPASSLTLGSSPCPSGRASRRSGLPSARRGEFLARMCSPFSSASETPSRSGSGGSPGCLTTSSVSTMPLSSRMLGGGPSSLTHRTRPTSGSRRWSKAITFR